MSPDIRDTRSNYWKRIVIEGVTIVGSILLAFAIDAWWDERQQRIEEVEILRGLKGEFSRYRDELTEGIEYHANARRMVAELIAATRTNSWTSTTLEIDLALATLADAKTHDFGGGILDAVINGGRLEIISDYGLRNKLASWRQVFNEIRDDEIRNKTLAENRVVPYMLRWHIPQSRGLELCCSWSKWPQSTRSIADDPGAVSRLLADPEFEVLLELKHIEVAHTALEYDTGLQAINEILEAIDASLAE
jgi:hypothetical protein